MPTLDAFSQQIVDMVREFPDEALLELIRDRLGGITAAPAGARAPAKGRRKAGGARRTRATSGDREQLLLLVERLVKGSRGLSSTEIARMTKAATPRVQSVLRELKHAKRIFQGGDRRFARYAGDPQTAKAASVNTRKNPSR